MNEYIRTCHIHTYMNKQITKQMHKKRVLQKSKHIYIYIYIHTYIYIHGAALWILMQNPLLCAVCAAFL